MDIVKGKITILKIPNIQKGGSRKVDLARLKKEISDETIIGALGIEALTALRQIGTNPTLLFGTKDAIIEAAQCGLSSVVVCVDDNLPELLQTFEERRLTYKVIELFITQ